MLCVSIHKNSSFSSDTEIFVDNEEEAVKHPFMFSDRFSLKSVGISKGSDCMRISVNWSFSLEKKKKEIRNTKIAFNEY